ncbi:ParB N-terminal domain-containing protein [Rhodanobacter ginsengisoli]|uniref:ParB N-terminal domain-containing protein n=1 Tax=Rhodanobacter ginsengisoli TaxID=418646 RepID=A0ABW0QQ73_9GAMM
MDVERALQRLQAAEVQHLPLKALKTDEALQPREARMVPFREQTKVERRSEEHTGTMRLALEAARNIELEPVLVADVGGVTYVVDGHHRLKAYRLAQRETIPARVLPMAQTEAVLVSKLVNCAERALEMHKEQRLDAAWQYLAAVTHRGAKGLPTCESFRTVAGRFGIGKDTVRTMLRKLPKVNLKGWNTEALDPGTGFPRWRYVREGGGGWYDMKEKMSMEQLTRHAAEKAAKKIGAVLEKLTTTEAALALEILANEAKLAACNADTLAFLADIADPDPNPDY